MTSEVVDSRGVLVQVHYTLIVSLLYRSKGVCSSSFRIPLCTSELSYTSPTRSITSADMFFSSTNFIVLRSFSQQERPWDLLKNRLHVGNLLPTVDECISLHFFCALNVQYRAKGHVSRSRYTLIQILSKVGKQSQLDFLFHKSGPLGGKPRGSPWSSTSTRAKR